MRIANKLRIASLVASGNGANVVHSQLAEKIEGYTLTSLPPHLTSIPHAGNAYNYYRFHNADVIHAIPEYGGGALPKKRPVICTFHNYYCDDEYIKTCSKSRQYYYTHIMRKALRTTMQRANQITVVSKYIWNKVKAEHPSCQPILIYNGIDTEKFHPENREHNDDEFKLLFVGNPIARKGIDTLTSLLNELPDNCNIYYTSGLRAVPAPQAHARLKAIPWTAHDDMPHVYNSCDALLFPTKREGFGLAIAEAMACGLPIISSNISAIPELVAHDKGGYLITPGDKQQLLKSITTLISNKNLRSDMAAWNRDRIVKNFRMSTMIKNYSEVFSYA